LSPYSWVCSNLAGEFQYGTFSIFVNAAVVLIWKLPTIFSATGGRAVDDSFVRPWCGRIFARARKESLRSTLADDGVGDRSERLDHLLGGNELVRGVGSLCVVTVGVVESGART
jgi:hypothetical protein